MRHITQILLTVIICTFQRLLTFRSFQSVLLILFKISAILIVNRLIAFSGRLEYRWLVLDKWCYCWAKFRLLLKFIHFANWWLSCIRAFRVLISCGGYRLSAPIQLVEVQTVVVLVRIKLRASDLEYSLPAYPVFSALNNDTRAHSGCVSLAVALELLWFFLKLCHSCGFCSITALVVLSTGRTRRASSEWLWLYPEAD